jgi:hypothetical protein
MNSRIAIPDDFLINDDKPIQDEVIRVCLSDRDIVKLFSGEEIEHDSVGLPKIIIKKVWGN